MTFFVVIIGAVEFGEEVSWLHLLAADRGDPEEQLKPLCALHMPLWDTHRRKTMKALQIILFFLNMGKNEIDLKHRAQQKILWFIFASPADSCCSGKPARAAEEELCMKQNEQALIAAATATQLY